MTDWWYTPVTIHCNSITNESTIKYAISGIYLFNKLTNNYFVLSLTSVPGISSCTFRFTSQDLINSKEINWLPLVLNDVKSVKLDKKKGSFISFVQSLVSNSGFHFKPHKMQDLCVLTFKLGVPLVNSSIPLFDINNLLPLNMIPSTQVDLPCKVEISCCPFSLTNPAVFIGYKHHGSVNYKIGKGSGFLSDCRYMDDIIGGHVGLDGVQNMSIGLVAGSLSKTNGDGDLLAIISWNTIIDLLDYPDFYLESSSGVLTSQSTAGSLTEIVPYTMSSVVRVSIETTKGEHFWGSGVIISDSYIITNEHVLKYNELKWLRISVPNNPYLKISLEDVEIIGSPIKGYDISFIRLRKANRSLHPARLCTNGQSQVESLQVGQLVKSIGYGLFYKHQSPLTPFYSEGRINSLASLEIEEGCQELALVLVSAGCWNGSSGGGVFNENDELIGIMTSNGKLSNGEIIPNFTFMIPITIIEKCLFKIANDLAPMNATQKVMDLWTLKNTHKNKFVDKVSYKL